MSDVLERLLEHSVILSNALVEWAIPETFRNHTVRLGGFHTLSCYIAAIGKLWGDGGLKDLLVDSSVSEIIHQRKHIVVNYRCCYISSLIGIWFWWKCDSKFR
jgi:hypothetical protein